MLVSPMSIAAPSPVPLPTMDHRPTADAAALARDPTPFMPMPMSSPYTQKGAVAEARLTDTTRDVTMVERVLKPYGVTMLPRSQTDTKTSTGLADAPDRAASAQADGGPAMDDTSTDSPAPKTGSSPTIDGVLDSRPSPAPLPG